MLHDFPMVGALVVYDVADWVSRIDLLQNFIENYIYKRENRHRYHCSGASVGSKKAQLL